MTEEALQPVASSLAIRRLYCAQAVFRHTLVPPQDNPPPPGVNLDARMTLAFEEDADNPERLGVILRLVLEPDPEKNQPYHVDVAYRGDFLLASDLQGLDKKLLSSTNCAAILFPYLRQTVSDLTSRGTNGAIFLPPINVAAMLTGAQDAKGTEGGRIGEEVDARP